MKKTLITLVSTFLLIQFSFSQSNQEGYLDLSKSFFSKYQNQGFDKALDFIFSTNQYLNIKDDQVVNTKKKIKESSNLIGEFVSYNLITVKKATDDFVYCSYLVKYTRQPLRFTFIFL